MIVPIVVNRGKVNHQFRGYFTELGVAMAAELKPIAVLTDRITRAIDYLVIDKGVEFTEVRKDKRRLVGKDGTVYVLCYDPEQLMGWEFSSIIVVPGASNKPGFLRLYDTARTRVR